MGARVTWPERPKGAKDKVTQSRPEGPPTSMIVSSVMVHNWTLGTNTHMLEKLPELFLKKRKKSEEKTFELKLIHKSRTKSSRPEGPPTKSRGPTGP